MKRARRLVVGLLSSTPAPAGAAGVAEATAAPHLIYLSDLTADEHYLVTTGLTTESQLLNVADLVERRAWTLPLPAGQGIAEDLAINRGWLHPGLLAIHDGEDAVVHRLEPQGRLEELSRLGLERVPWLGPYGGLPGAPMAWSGSGGDRGGQGLRGDDGAAGGPGSVDRLEQGRDDGDKAEQAPRGGTVPPLGLFHGLHGSSAPPARWAVTFSQP